MTWPTEASWVSSTAERGADLDRSLVAPGLSCKFTTQALLHVDFRVLLVVVWKPWEVALKACSFRS